MFNELQKLTIQAIVNIFETGKPTGNYGAVTFRKDDVGCLTFGRSQTTLASGGLAVLIRQYCDASDAALAEKLRPYLARLKARDRSLDTDVQFASILCKAGADPIMRTVEDSFFDRAYWDPALRATQALGIATALGTAVVYDSFIHGAWARMRRATAALVGLPSVAPKGQRVAPAVPAKEASPSVAAAEQLVHTSGVGELAWIGRYIAVRREWLATHTNALLRRTVYRMDTFAALAAAGNWDLDLPLEAHGVLLNEQNVAPEAAANVAASADLPGAG